MTSTPPEIGQPTRGARTGREDRGQRGNKWWTLVAVCLGTFMLLLDITIVQVALPDIQRALHSSFAEPFLPNRLDTRQSLAPCSKVSVTHAGDEPPHVTCSFPACEVDCKNRAA